MENDTEDKKTERSVQGVAFDKSMDAWHEAFQMYNNMQCAFDVQGRLEDDTTSAAVDAAIEAWEEAKSLAICAEIEYDQICDAEEHKESCDACRGRLKCEEVKVN